MRVVGGRGVRVYDYTRAIYWSQQVLAAIVDLMVPSGLYGYTHAKIGLFFLENFERKFRQFSNLS